MLEHENTKKGKDYARNKGLILSIWSNLHHLL